MAEKLKNFISIDIDYFQGGQGGGASPAQAEKFLVEFLAETQGRDIPMVAVMNHQQLLPYVNKAGKLGVRQLINVDMHSDLAGFTDPNKPNHIVYNCGTWVAFVKWRMQGQYLWIRSDQDFDPGNCNGGDDTKHFWNSNTDWLKTSTECYEPKHQLPEHLYRYLPQCVGLGLCMSPGYANISYVNLFRKIVKFFDISYKKGRKEEGFAGDLKTPPGRKVSNESG